MSNEKRPLESVLVERQALNVLQIKVTSTFGSGGATLPLKRPKVSCTGNKRRESRNGSPQPPATSSVTSGIRFCSSAETLMDLSVSHLNPGTWIVSLYSPAGRLENW